MPKYIKNNTGSDKTYVGQVINPSQYYLIQDIEDVRWANDSTLLTDIGSGEAIVAKTDSGSDDILDVNTAINYLKNKPTPTDVDGVPLARTKVTQSSWHYQEHGIEVTTAKLDGVVNINKAGTNLNFTTITLYDDQGAPTTTELDAVKTVITWEPTYDFEIIGGQLYQATAPTSDFRLFVIALPDYPAPSGSIPFLTGGVNLRYMGVGKVLCVDGRSAKKLLYANPVPGTNKFELTFMHAAGYQHTLQFIVGLFKP